MRASAHSNRATRKPEALFRRLWLRPEPFDRLPGYHAVPRRDRVERVAHVARPVADPARGVVGGVPGPVDDRVVEVIDQASGHAAADDAADHTADNRAD